LPVTISGLKKFSFCVCAALGLVLALVLNFKTGNTVPEDFRMSSRLEGRKGHFATMLLALAALLLLVGGSAAAQDQPAPKWELFGGYSWIDPNTNQHAVIPGFPGVSSSKLVSEPRGMGTALTYNFNRWLGGTADFSAHWGGDKARIPLSNDSNIFNLSFGPKLTYRTEHFSPFVEALVGWHQLHPDGFNSDNRIGFLGGGGIDMDLTKHLALRLIQADYMLSNHHFGSGSVVPATELRAPRLQSGVVWKMGGGPPPPPPAMACSVAPNEVMAGEPVKVTATASNFPQNHTVSYTWASTGGKVSGSDATATVDTTGLAPGSYTVTAKATDKKKANAECSSNFTVKEPPKNPPTVSCSANPASVKSGDPSTITCDCKSPDNRSVSLSNWNASGGKVSGSGNTATLDTAGAPAGAINVTATCSDDRGLTADGSTSVNVEVPPPAPQASKLNEINFKKNNARVDNAAKAVLDQVADRLQQDPNAKAVIIGETDASEKGKNLAAQRAVNAKAYLTSGENQKAIDPSRIQVVTGGPGGMRDEIWVVPEGATFNEPNTTPVDESKVKPQAGHAHHAAAPKKKTAKKAAPAAQ
jgi:outer membrane protein OmpA-like peptidoglycan-associated protein/opacity protein-like surface antigen